MRRSRIGLLASSAALVFVGGLPSVATAQPSPQPSPSDSGIHQMFGGVLHGEGILQTKHGPVQVAMQNGEATSLTSTAVTVRSSDGFTRTWAIDHNLRVYDKRNTLQPKALQTGAHMIIAGEIAGGAPSPAPNGGTASPGPATYTAHVVFVHSD